jgi:predicted amidohydrolase
MVRLLRRRQAQILLVPTGVAAPLHSLKPITDALVPTRALENNMFVFYCNRVGQETTLSFLGRSTVAGPNGVILAQLKDKTESVVVEVRMEEVLNAIQDHPFLQDMRVDLFNQ